MKFLKKHAHLAIVFTFVFMMGYIIFFSTEHHYVISKSNKLLISFYAIPAAIIFACFVSLIAGKEWTKAAAASIVAACVGTYSAEIFLTLRNSLEPNTVFKPHPFRTDFAQYKRLKTNLKNVFPAVQPISLLKENGSGEYEPIFFANESPILPLSGVPNVTTVYCDEGYGTIIYKSDAYGFRNDEGIWRAPNPPIAAIGDSYTQGACVENGKSYVNLLNNSWPGTINLGMSGNGPLLMLASIKEFLPAVRPKLVIWFYCENNDLSDLEKEASAPILRNYLNTDFQQNLMKMKAAWSSKLKSYLKDLAHQKNRQKAYAQNTKSAFLKNNNAKNEFTFIEITKSIISLRSIRGALGLFHFRIDRSKIQLLERIFKEAKTTVGTWGGEIVFVTVPSTVRIFGKPLDRAFPDAHSSYIQEIAKNAGLKTFDPKAAFLEHANPRKLFPPNGGHFSPLGNSVFAEAVSAFIAPILENQPSPGN